MTRDLILAIDGGQTATKGLLARRDGTILASGRGGPCDHLNGPNGVEKNRAAIHAAARAALAAAGRDAADIVAVGMGMTSAPRGAGTEAIFDGIVREVCQPDAFWVDSDSVSNLYGASGGQPGIVVIAGGGSIGYGVDADGKEAFCGGLGYLFGDEGSAWYIGLQALIAAAKAVDRRGPATDLLPFVMEHFGLGTIRQIMGVVYDKDFRRDQVSVLAPEVVRIASHDCVAREIVRGAGDKLGQIAVGAIRQLHAAGDAVDVFPTGGVFAAGPLVTEPFHERLAADWPAATVRDPRFPPVAGALLQALRALGDEITPDLLARMDATMP